MCCVQSGVGQQVSCGVGVDNDFCRAVLFDF